MVESIMFFAGGFILAALIFGLGLTSLVHNRAVRLTMRRLEAATPLSMAEIQAEKDQLRAEFAMSTRRLELSVEQMRAKTTGQLAELGKKTDAINRLKVELGEKTAAIFALEAREKTLREQLHATEGEHSVKLKSLREAEHLLAAKETELAHKEAEISKVTAELGQHSLQSDSQRIEIATLRTQIDALKERVSEFEREAHAVHDRLERERKEAGAASAELAEERGRGQKLGERVSELERALVAQTTEAEILNRRVEELETRLNGQMAALSDRDTQISKLSQQLSVGQKTETDLKAELAARDTRGRSVAESLRIEKQTLEAQLTQSQEEGMKLLAELASLKREAEQTWAAERVENALLRERINDIAAEVARLTIALEGQDSPIEAMLAAAGPAVAHGANGGKGTLADRIRALQSKASRIPVPN